MFVLSLMETDQAEDGRERPSPVVVAAAEFQIEQQSIVGHQIKTVCIHQ